MRRPFAIVALLALLTATACGSAQPITHPPDAEARAFALRMIDVIERDDFEGWRALLSTRLLLHTDPAELRRMFDTWRRFFVPHAVALRDADWTLASNDMLRYRTAGRSAEPLVRVVDEDGALRIDDN